MIFMQMLLLLISFDLFLFTMTNLPLKFIDIISKLVNLFQTFDYILITLCFLFKAHRVRANFLLFKTQLRIILHHNFPFILNPSVTFWSQNWFRCLPFFEMLTSFLIFLISLNNFLRIVIYPFHWHILMFHVIFW